MLTSSEKGGKLMSQKRKSYGAECKAKATLEAVREAATVT